MGTKILIRKPRVPVFLQRRSTDEFLPLPYSPAQQRIVANVRSQGPEHSKRIAMTLADYWTGRQGTAAALRAVDEAWGGGFYNVPEEATLDRAAADAALGGGDDYLVIDVQTHFVSERSGFAKWTNLMVDQCQSVASDRFKGLDKLLHTQYAAGYTLAEYLRCVFLGSETAVAVLSSSPGAEGQEQIRLLTNAESVGTRELIDRLGGTGRLINHCVVSPNVGGEIEQMDRWKGWCQPGGWKVYTMFGPGGEGPMKWDGPAWTLDDDDCGQRFLQNVRNSGVRVVSAHKGVSPGMDTSWTGPSSPRDVGPAAKAFPDINFLIYHSGYEPREGDREEGPYSEEVSRTGTNRLIKSLKDAGIGPGGNVYAELGSTWFLLMAHPREAAHVMGKLLAALGEDNIVWGTDSLWYGPTQPLIDGFRAFQIPDEYRERYGYPQLTTTAKKKILGLNAARIYGLDPAKVLEATRRDDLAWVKAAMEESAAKGTPSAA